MLNFKSFQAAKNVLAGIELMHMIRKGQTDCPGGQTISAASSSTSWLFDQQADRATLFGSTPLMRHNPTEGSRPVR
jgi:hypothetical protein